MVGSDIAASYFHAGVHSKDGRWKLRPTIAVPSYVATGDAYGTSLRRLRLQVFQSITPSCLHLVSGKEVFRESVS